MLLNFFVGKSPSIFEMQAIAKHRELSSIDIKAQTSEKVMTSAVTQKIIQKKTRIGQILPSQRAILEMSANSDADLSMILFYFLL